MVLDVMGGRASVSPGSTTTSTASSSVTDGGARMSLFSKSRDRGGEHAAPASKEALECAVLAMKGPFSPSRDKKKCG